ncbi:AMP-binding protein [Agrobacterium sp. CCNWLW71]|uniref:AMP-binding protein n=1 Tax=unclassified Agrobacterium TaxID=2632611 RepID=UPI002FEEE897
MNTLNAPRSTEQVEFVVRGPEPIRAPFSTVGQMLAESAGRFPNHPLLIHPRGEEVTVLTHGEAWERARNLADALIEFGLSAERPLAILSGNSIDHALLSLAAQIAGVPVAPISAAYSHLKDLGRLRQVLEILSPGLVFAEDGKAFAGALELALSLGAATAATKNGSDQQESLAAQLFEHRTTKAFRHLAKASDTAKILFTSGSTGVPKGVMVTHEMICSNQDAIVQVWPFLKHVQPMLVDWLPWNHVFGGNIVFTCAIRNGGTLVIDEGRPLPGQFDRTLRNLRDYPPTIHFGVPRGFEELVNALEGDEEAARSYFGDLRVMFTAGASLPSTVWERYRALGAKYGRPDLGVHVSWGSTETAPIVSASPRDNERPDNLGAPFPGAEIKLVPNGDKYELRIRGPMVTPGYWRRPDLTAEAFDQDGFYCIGDAGKFLDPEDPSKGILFDGRIAENFKLITGTWVQAGLIRPAAVSAGRSLIQDAVVTGHDRHEVGLLIFLNRAVASQLASLPDATLDELARSEVIRERISGILGELSGSGSSSRVARALILSDLPSIEAGEITDKGYLNQRALLRSRADMVERLYADPLHPDVILPASPKKPSP